MCFIPLIQINDEKIQISSLSNNVFTVIQNFEIFKLLGPNQ